MLSNSLKSVILIAGMAAACGPQPRNSKGVPSSTQKSDKTALAELSCPEKGDCAPGRFVVAASPIVNGKAIGQSTGPVVWQFYGIIENAPTRVVKLAAFTPPAGGTFSGQETKNVNLVWPAPVAGDSGAQPMQVILRDVTRCEHDYPQYKAQCANMKQKGLEGYELAVTVPWEITAPATVGGGTTPPATTPTVAPVQQPVATKFAPCSPTALQKLFGAQASTASSALFSCVSSDGK